MVNNEHNFLSWKIENTTKSRIQALDTTWYDSIYGYIDIGIPWISYLGITNYRCNKIISWEEEEDKQLYKWCKM